MTPDDLRKTCKMKMSSFVGNGPPYTATRYKCVYCAKCWQPIGTEDRKAQTEKGVMHESCACVIAFKKLEEAKIPKPATISIGAIESHLYETIKKLNDQPKVLEDKLAVIFEIAEFLNAPIRWSEVLPKFSLAGSQ